MICSICDRTPLLAWCDIHGFAQCLYCGAPYELGEDWVLRIEEAWVPTIKAYWKETGRHVAPGAYCIPGSDRGRRFIPEDAERLAVWIREHPPVLE